ncbi:MAG: 16S rRNA (guanine(966)-N(2))-methyltransferase RsmD [Clostridia bacterium]|nr:16S rRNA (guanine(966)-N(2))-methyltransferase RsmD [Clostridia bacterium]
MRVIAGIARNRKLNTLDGEDVRPTIERTKEAIFSAIQFEIEGTDVLDLFAGSGQLGIEAVSRGARSATFVDSSKQSIEVVRKNVASVGFDSRSKIVNAQAETFVKTAAGKYHIAFLDPPYSRGILQSILPEVEKIMAPGGIIVCEHPYGEEMPESVGRFENRRDYKYGKVAVTIYRD